ncbi:MAG: glycerol-3-phosphate dehydrogenase [Burkholderiales bacterium]|nr:glycerol-3-phosphate dehydrogenase [Burkholderiales bacterium]
MDSCDLLVVGGGINGAGIARDAAGRGLAVVLAEQDDLGGHTSSASSKLVHGGLRYLEQYRFRLVAEALAEREVLLRAAPHLVRPLRFVMPYARGLRPAWMIRAGLVLYDFLARRATLPASRAVALRGSRWGAGLKPEFERGFAYSDCWVDDARLVIANARDAVAAGAIVLPRTRCTRARREGGVWRALLESDGAPPREVRARALANVTGPWVKSFLRDAVNVETPFGVKLVKGSHIVVPGLYDGEHAYILQNDDRRVVFVYAYEPGLTLIGTTDIEHHGEPGRCEASAEEAGYLCRAVNRYFARQIAPGDIVWSYCGIRPLFDDGSTDPSSITRDYVLRVDTAPAAAPVLSVFGGKITTYRKLAEHALAALAPWFPRMRPAWTAGRPLPGGELRGESFEDFTEVRLKQTAPWLPATVRRGLARRHGTLAADVLAGAADLAAMGEHFGGGLYAREIDYFIAREWARRGEDVLWRRSKAGLAMTAAERAAAEAYVARRAVR